MQIDSFAKIIYVHIPRTGGRWFSHGWRSHTDFRGECNILDAKLINTQNEKKINCGRHGRLAGILEKLDAIGIDHTKYKKITIVREPVDRILSSWVYFFKEKGLRHQTWKTIDDMLDSYEAGNESAMLRPQTFWLCEKNAKFDHIFKFEDLLLSQKNIRAMWHQFKCRDPLIRSGRVNGYHESLTKEQIKRIKKVYKDDIEFLSNYYPHL